MIIAAVGNMQRLRDAQPGVERQIGAQEISFCLHPKSPG